MPVRLRPDPGIRSCPTAGWCESATVVPFETGSNQIDEVNAVTGRETLQFVVLKMNAEEDFPMVQEEIQKYYGMQLDELPDLPPKEAPMPFDEEIETYKRQLLVSPPPEADSLSIVEDSAANINTPQPLAPNSLGNFKPFPTRAGSRRIPSLRSVRAMWW